MITRPFWINRIEKAWLKRPIVWLAGVRRVGKTTLAKMLPETLYLNCDLPSTLRRLEDPEFFFRGLRETKRIILDEVHRLPDPSLPLKIAADEFPHLRILATGSSTLASARKFRDTLTGRKISLYLPPVLWTECESVFDLPDLDRRLLRGGLPELMLSDKQDPDFLAEWLDSYYARDIQELFSIRGRAGFLNLLRLMLRQSGGLADYSALSRECDLSRSTVKSYLEAMTVACAVFPVPPFSGRGRREIVRRPRVYAFDTGFVAFNRGWDTIRDEDRGFLWEHLVLDCLRSSPGRRHIHFWRDKSGREIDFVVPGPGRRVDTFECKINPDRFVPDSLRVFREIYPEGRDIVVCPGVRDSYQKSFGRRVVKIIPCRDLFSLFLQEI